MQKVKVIILTSLILFLTNLAVLLAQELEAIANRKAGIEYASQGKFSEAEQEFKQSLEKDKADNASEDALFVLSDFSKGKISQNYAIFLFRGLNYLQNAELQNAVGEFEKAIEENPAYPKAYNLLGVIYASQGEFEKAASYFAKALEIKPDYTEAAYNLAAAYHALGRVTEAVVYYEKVIQKEPRSFEARMSLGSAYTILAKYPHAITHYQKAKEIDKDNPLVYYSLGRVYLLIDDYAKSRENLDRAKDLFRQKADTEGIQESDRYLAQIVKLEAEQASE